jgi:hypothetical protein
VRAGGWVRVTPCTVRAQSSALTCWPERKDLQFLLFLAAAGRKETEVTEEAYELVEEGKITDEDFRDFVFVNPTKLWTDMNPNFFKGTRVEPAITTFLHGK